MEIGINLELNNKKIHTHSSVRDSNMEFVRIIAMSMILIYHFIVHGGPGPEKVHGLTLIVTPGVILFILLSGFYNIKLKLQGIFRLINLILFFQIINLLCLYLIKGSILIDTSDLIKTFIAPLSHNQYWFIQNYFVLMVLSPWLNRGLLNMNIKDLRSSILMLTIIEGYSCGLMNNGVDQNGYGLFNFIYFFGLGYYLRKEPFIKDISIKSLVLFGLSSLLLNIILVNILHINGLKYSSILNILYACSFILIFSRLKFSSSKILIFSKSALGCYLLQDGILGNLIYSFQNTLFKENFKEWLIFCILLFFLFWIISLIVTPIVNNFTNTILNVKLLKSSFRLYNLHDRDEPSLNN